MSRKSISGAVSSTYVFHDVPSVKELAVVVWYYSERVDAFKTAFLALMPVIDTSPEELISGLTDFRQKCGIPEMNCASVGTDGASVVVVCC